MKDQSKQAGAVGILQETRAHNRMWISYPDGLRMVYQQPGPERIWTDEVSLNGFLTSDTQYKDKD